MKNSLRNALVGAAVAIGIVGGSVAPAAAYTHGQVYGCTVTKTTYTSYSKTYNYKCKQQFGSIPGVYTWYYYSKTYPLRGTTW